MCEKVWTKYHTEATSSGDSGENKRPFVDIETARDEQNRAIKIDTEE